MDNSSWNVETPLTASLDPAGNISTLKVLMTERAGAYADARTEDVLPPEFPWTVGLSPTSRCPRACFFCSHTKRNRLGHYLSKNVMQRIHADLRRLGSRGIIYAGGGDPLAWEDNLIPLIEQSTEFCDVGIDTNGVLAHRLVTSSTASQIFYITISLLAHEPRLYEEICGRNQFNIVHRNILALTELARRTADSRLRINVKLSVNRRSYKHFLAMCRYAQSLGVHNIFARCMNNFERGQKIELRRQEKQELYDTILQESGLPVDYVETFARNLLYPAQLPAGIRPPSRCWSVLLGHNLGIKPDGECYLCVPTTGQPEFSIGNVIRRNLTELWGAARHLEVIRRLDQRLKTGGCDPSRCRHHRLNLIIEGSLHGSYKKPADSLYEALHASFL